MATVPMGFSHLRSDLNLTNWENEKHDSQDAVHHCTCESCSECHNTTITVTETNDNCCAYMLQSKYHNRQVSGRQGTMNDKGRQKKETVESYLLNRRSYGSARDWLNIVILDVFAAIR